MTITISILYCIVCLSTVCVFSSGMLHVKSLEKYQIKSFVQNYYVGCNISKRKASLKVT